MRMIILAAAGLLAACTSDTDYGQTVGYTAQPVTIVAVDRPKHFNVDVRLPSGKIMRGVARRKHCNRWQSTATIGATYTVPFRITRNSKGQQFTFMDEYALEGLLCD